MGNPIIAFLYPLNICNDVIYTELFALYYSLLPCKRLNLNNLWIEQDAFNAISIINSVECKNAALFYLVKNIKLLLNDFTYQITHILHEGNKCVDWLANNACDIIEIMEYYPVNIPTILNNFIRMDKGEYLISECVRLLFSLCL